MALSAIINGERMISVLMREAEWAEARRLAAQYKVRIAETGMPGHPQTSPLGLRYFAHMPGFAPEEKGEPEGIEHLMLKAELVRKLAAAGWAVDTELASGPGREWVADVLAEKNGQRYAFEVQWSKQSVGDYIRRQARYATAGIRGIWLAREAPEPSSVKNGLLVPDYEQIPIFRLSAALRLSSELRAGNPEYTRWMTSRMEATQGARHLGRVELSIQQLVATVDSDALVYYGTVPYTLYKVECWRCKQDMVCWTVGDRIGGPALERPEAEPLVVGEMKRVLAASGSTTPPAALEVRGTPATGDYMAFCCPNCQAVQQPRFEGRHLLAAQQRANRHITGLIATTREWDDFVKEWRLGDRRWVHLRYPTA